MITVNVNEPAARLAELVEALERGEEVIVARAHEPVARLVPYRRRPVRLGDWNLGLRVAPDWDGPEANRAVAELFDGHGGDPD